MENNKIVYRTFITTMQMLRDRNYFEGYLLSISKNQLVNISKLIDMSFNDFMLSFGKDNALEIASTNCLLPLVLMNSQY